MAADFLQNIISRSGINIIKKIRIHLFVESEFWEFGIWRASKAATVEYYKKMKFRWIVYLGPIEIRMYK